ncbi:endolytic transglycosylase MltG [Candidatus Viridilinea mediisalina]|uniref:Endolytic murein transglycosylase n=1 Tax=Candidatus Viridilinea mediisalina TaxID=2024553 RepID=A0A2A6RLL0_9CHLR|nr:endolytic transglycosylase MltG [Candidatus Viridilinea mediisalina]PDW03769.1 aminodeoxychorismate lyase [Candidatus Viridilinea mediisalina]
MRHVRALMLGVALLALVVAGLGYLALGEIRAPAATSGQPVEFVVAHGASTSEIATRLRSEGLIRQPVLFTMLSRMQGLDAQLHSGRFVLSPTMNMSQILIALQSNRIDDIAVTLREGLRLEEVADILAQAEIVEAELFLAAARDAERFRAQYFLLNQLPPDATLEGYLFPDTYRFYRDAEPDVIIRTMLDRFVEQYATIERNVQVPDVSVHQLVTMASIVQREAALESEMPLIAGVFWNRLKPEYAPIVGGGQLGADATVQYALGFSEDEATWWRKELTFDDLQIDSPYNTRNRAGLPPGPIAAPGLAALTAAAQPDDAAGYLFFVASCERDGSHKFAASFDQFLSYEAEWLACQ